MACACKLSVEAELEASILLQASSQQEVLEDSLTLSSQHFRGKTSPSELEMVAAQASAAGQTEGPALQGLAVEEAPAAFHLKESHLPSEEQAGAVAVASFKAQKISNRRMVEPEEPQMHLREPALATRPPASRVERIRLSKSSTPCFRSDSTEFSTTEVQEEDSLEASFEGTTHSVLCKHPAAAAEQAISIQIGPP